MWFDIHHYYCFWFIALKCSYLAGPHLSTNKVKLQWKQPSCLWVSQTRSWRLCIKCWAWRGWERVSRFAASSWSLWEWLAFEASARQTQVISPLWSANLTLGCATIAALNTRALISFMMQSDVSSFPEKPPHCVYPGSSPNPRSPLMEAFDSAAHGSGNPQRQKQEVEAVEGNPDTVSLLFSFSYETNLKTFLWSTNSEICHTYRSTLQLWT